VPRTAFLLKRVILAVDGDFAEDSNFAEEGNFTEGGEFAEYTT
jgi:hypothetical protein